MTHYDRGRRVTGWRLAAVRVWGGFRVRWERWVFIGAGWDLESEPAIWSDLYPDSSTAIYAAWDWVQLTPSRNRRHP